MKIENTLELDLEAFLKRRRALDYLPKTRFLAVLLGSLALAVLLILVLSPRLSWLGAKSLPMSSARFTPENSQQRISKRIPYYDFAKVGESFGGVGLSRIREFQKDQFENLIISASPEIFRSGVQEYLPFTLEMAQKYKVDPFWVLAVMWTESHFNPQATSRVQAQGLMQIMPATGKYLAAKMGRLASPLFDPSEFKHLKPHEMPLKDPQMNIEMGAFYLRQLYDEFSGSYRLATVAYNMGPNGVKRRLRRNLPTGVRNLYLDKVRRAYKRLTRDYLRYLAKHEPPFVKTYVAASQVRPQLANVEQPLDELPFNLPKKPAQSKTAFIGNWSPVLVSFNR